jgi:hypothetical protein
LSGVALVHGEPQWVRCRPRRGTHGCMEEPGSSPWEAASMAPAVGWRERDGMHGAVFMAAETTAFLPLATVRFSHGHGEVTAARPSGARRRARRRHEKGAKGPALPSRLRRTRAGVHACEHRGQHGRARRHARDADATWAHRHGAAKRKPRKQGSQACLAPAGPAPPRGQLRLRGGRCCSGRLRSPPPLPLLLLLRLRVGGQGIGFPRGG